MLQQNTFNTQQYEEKTYNFIAVENVPFACVLCCAVLCARISIVLVVILFY